MMISPSLAAGETFHHGGSLSSAIFLFDGHAQVLLLFFDGLLFVLAFSLIGEVGIGGVDDVQTVFPVVVLHNSVLVWLQR